MAYFLGTVSSEVFFPSLSVFFPFSFFVINSRFEIQSVVSLAESPSREKEMRFLVLRRSVGDDKLN